MFKCEMLPTVLVPRGGAFGGAYGIFRSYEISWREYVTRVGSQMLQPDPACCLISGSKLLMQYAGELPGPAAKTPPS